MNIISLFTTILLITSGPQLTQTTDLGLIGYFEGDCPEGWVNYHPLQGRVAVGAGTYVGTAEDGRFESETYLIGDTGGEVSHKLTDLELAVHNHANEEYKYMLKSDGHWTMKRSDYSSSEPNLVYKGEILPAGGDKPHNNMQPYVVVRPCQKITDEVGPLKEELAEAKNERALLRGQIETLQAIVEQLLN